MVCAFLEFCQRLVGFIPGLLRYWNPGKVNSIGSFGKLLFLLLAASNVPSTLSIGAEIYWGNITFHNALFQLFLPIFITDTLWASNDALG